jgi:hypothetical protein
MLERAVERYVRAVDDGDLDAISAVLEEAVESPELDRVIAEINLALQDEEQLAPLSSTANLVRDLVRQHFHSAFGSKEDLSPVTVGEVAARLQVERTVPSSDQLVNNSLLGNLAPVPTWLGIKEVRQLASDLGVAASEKYWRLFRDTAIMLGMRHSHYQAQLAAREERSQYPSRPKRRGKNAHGVNTDAHGEEKE